MDMNDEKIILTQSGCTVHVNASRVAIELPTETKCGTPFHGWNSLSSATLNGGFRSFPCRSSPPFSSDDADKIQICGVINCKVPASYDGIHPDPATLIQNAIRNDGDVQLNADSTVGLMTAAYMKTLRTATRSSSNVVVDAIVTAGVSNARAVGADADCFDLPVKSKNQDKAKTTPPPPGTINTVVVINAPLSQSAMVEAYAIAIEAKCAACFDLSLTCAKSGKSAQGTGTDCVVLVCPTTSITYEGADNVRIDENGKNNSYCDQISYAGKHTLLGEFIGQAVREATSEAIRANIRELHGSIWRYYCARYLKWIRNLILCGAQPCVPPFPMMPVPSAPREVLVLGVTLILFSFFVGSLFLPRSATVLMAAASWDRCLPSVPLAIHPVVLAGKVISFVTTKMTPERVYQNPAFGFLGGLAFLVGMISLFVYGGHLFLSSVQWMTRLFSTHACYYGHTYCDNHKKKIQIMMDFMSWIAEVALVGTTFSLQLLCTIALQMARFLERSQLDEARSQLSWLCSRDPTHLNAEDLAGATLESLSENLSDGTIAPWFWYVTFGPLGALGYRIANTLDSRVGYRGGKYEWFGKPSARFDDLINLIPARVTAIALCLAAYIIPNKTCCAKTGLKTAWKDCSQCSSPNAGWPMAAMAGILQVRLEKKGEYCLGKNIIGVKDSNPSDIRAGHCVAQVAGGLSLLAAIFVLCFSH